MVTHLPFCDSAQSRGGRALRRRLTVFTAAFVLLATLTAGILAAPKRARVAHSVYAAFSLVSRSKPTTTRCGSYVVTRSTLVGTVTSPEPALGGRATMVTKVAVNRGTGYGFATGTLTIRSNSGAVRLKGTMRGVISNTVVANGLISGTFANRSQQLLANSTLVFNETYSFVAVRLGIESSQNSAVAYPVGRRCP